MAWDWDAYFNSGSRPVAEHGERVAPSRAPHLRLVQEMNWDPYFNSDTAPTPVSPGRSPLARIRAVRPGHRRQSGA